MHYIYCYNIKNGDIGDSKSMPLNKNDSILIKNFIKTLFGFAPRIGQFYATHVDYI